MVWICSSFDADLVFDEDFPCLRSSTRICLGIMDKLKIFPQYQIVQIFFFILSLWMFSSDSIIHQSFMNFNLTKKPNLQQKT